jgi:aminoglycoside/choline kinase family phosphotransferase
VGLVSPPPIAEHPAALDAGWLTRALQAGGALAPSREVVDVDRRLVGTGQMSDTYWLGVRYQKGGDGPAALIAKLPSTDPTSRQTAASLRSYETEVRFYQQLAPHLPVRTPKVYYADVNPDTAAFVLLLEDLTAGRPGDQLVGCQLATASLAIAELVKLHTPYWGDPALAQLEWLHRDPDAVRASYLELLPPLWAGFLDRYDDQLDDDVRDAGAVVFDHLDTYVVPPSGPLTITHGDYRLDNLLFDAAPGGVPVAVVDWQTCGHGPGPADLAYFVGAGLLPDLRREAERDLVASYHAGLVDACISSYGWDQCWTDYRRGTWSGLVMAVAASMLVQRTDRGDQMFLTMARRHARHALDLDAATTIGG